jgi:hypothetical protein
MIPASATATNPPIDHPTAISTKLDLLLGCSVSAGLLVAVRVMLTVAVGLIFPVSVAVRLTVLVGLFMAVSVGLSLTVSVRSLVAVGLRLWRSVWESVGVLAGHCGLIMYHTLD